MPLPTSFVVKNGSKMCSRVVAIHPDAGVAHREQDVRPGRDLEMLHRVALVEGDVPGLDRDRPAVGHRVAGVDHEVDDDLVDLAGIGADVAGGGIQLEDQTPCSRR